MKWNTSLLDRSWFPRVKEVGLPIKTGFSSETVYTKVHHSTVLTTTEYTSLLLLFLVSPTSHIRFMLISVVNKSPYFE